MGIDPDHVFVQIECSRSASLTIVTVGEIVSSYGARLRRGAYTPVARTPGVPRSRFSPKIARSRCLPRRLSTRLLSGGWATHGGRLEGPVRSRSVPST